MTLFYLIRHAAHDNVGGFLAGRDVDVALGPEGLAQAARLGARMSEEPAERIHTSPRQRTRQTAEAIGSAIGLTPDVEEAIDEIDFGAEWCGRTFDDLNREPLWRLWNADRKAAVTPGGESLADVQRRVVEHIEGARESHPDRALVLVSHADVIKLAVLHYLDVEVDRIDRFDIAPASISKLAVGEWGAKLLSLNEQPCQVNRR